jgi:small acid-soluble spore protein A (major alpha-type SASP)
MTNKLIVPNVEFAIQQLKEEIANELGIELGAEQTARMNGKVGAEMTKRLVELGKQSLVESINTPVIAHYNLNQESTPQNQLH